MSDVADDVAADVAADAAFVASDTTDVFAAVTTDVLSQPRLPTVRGRPPKAAERLRRKADLIGGRRPT